MPDPHGNEEWRPVVGYEGLYSVSNHGRVRSECDRHRTFTGKLLKPYSAKSGYQLVSLTLDKKKKTHRVHALVLFAFVGPPPSQTHECRHLDGNPGHNSFGNLKWGTTTENRIDMKLHGTLPTGSNHGMAKLNEIDVEVILHLRKLGWTQTRIATAFCITHSSVYGIENGLSWPHVPRP